MDLDNYAFNNVIIYNLLLRQVANEKVDKDHLWFQI